MNDENLLDAALIARKSAHAPYSNFYVGAAILTHDGSVFSGCNVENIAFPEGVCAETGAISAMVLNGQTRIKKIVVVGAEKTASMGTCFPCGGCRQRILEFSDEETLVGVVDEGGAVVWHSMNVLIPDAFDSL